MTRVFVYRTSESLKPGDGGKISWEKGEEVRIVSGQDEGRFFVVLTEGLGHRDLPDGEFCREGYFTDDPDRTRWAKPENTLWFKER